jgi:hypothetical protein
VVVTTSGTVEGVVVAADRSLTTASTATRVTTASKAITHDTGSPPMLVRVDSPDTRGESETEPSAEVNCSSSGDDGVATLACGVSRVGNPPSRSTPQEPHTGSVGCTGA